MNLAHREPDGATLREHLQAAAKATGDTDPRLLRTVPAGCGALWGAFAELNGSRPLGMGAVGAIPLSEVEAWQRLNGVRLSPWEVETIIAMDRASVSVMAANAKRSLQ